MALTYSSNGNKVNCLVGQPYDVDLIAFSGEFGRGTPDLSPSPALVKRLHESRHGHSIIFLPAVDFFHFWVLISVDSGFGNHEISSQIPAQFNFSDSGPRT